MSARSRISQVICVTAFRLFIIGFSALAGPAAWSLEALPSESDEPSSTTARLQRLSLTELAITRNDGQWNDKVLYRAEGNGAKMWFTSDGVCYQLQRAFDVERSWRLTEERTQEIPELEPPAPEIVETRLIKATLVGANPTPQVVAEGEMEYKCNWFIGSNPARWCTDVPNYSTLVYKEVYPGIDVRYRGNGAHFEHDFIVASGADPSTIELRYEGAQSLEIDGNGDLIIVTDFGELVERIPRTYQERMGILESVSCCYEIIGGSTVRFLTDEGHDADLALVIDPVLEYSTYLGGTSVDGCAGIAVDDQGSAYVTGATQSSDFPTQDAYDTSFNSGPGYPDVFVTKLSSNGDALIYSTYIGGSFTDNPVDIAVDDSGCAYLTGNTQSSNYPTLNAFDASFNGGANWVMDAFVTKLAAAGNELVYSTFLGGGQGVGDDYGEAIAVDDSGCAYVTGNTPSTDFPTQNALDGTLDDNVEMDAFVTKFTAAGNALIYSTYLGGSLSEEGYDIAADGIGNAYVIGKTGSTDFPTQNAYDGTRTLSSDAFISKLSPMGDMFIYSTYLDLQGYSIAVDTLGRAYVTGSCGPTFPMVNAVDSTYNGGGDAFIAEFTAAGDALIYSTFLGGVALDQGQDIALDTAGNIYVSGFTDSYNFPILNSYDDSKFGGGGDYNGFVTKIRTPGDSLAYSTFTGGEDWGRPTIAVDNEGSAYLVGGVGGVNFPTVNSFDSTYNGAGDGYVIKLPTPMCHADPLCDGRIDILDIVTVVNVAFRNYPPPMDENCPVERTDVDCDMATAIVDVVKFVNVAFRNYPAATEFCSPCP